MGRNPLARSPIAYDDLGAEGPSGAMQWFARISHPLDTRELHDWIERISNVTWWRGGWASWITLTVAVDCRLNRVPMTQPILPTPLIRFEVFEIDLRAGELRKRGRRLKLQEQPFRVLAMLLERPGEVIPREDLRQKLWPADTFVDFDHGLNSAVARLREALSDSASQPRFIETVPRQGYRFIGVIDPSPSREPATQITSPALNQAAGPTPWIAAGMALFVLLCGIGIWWIAQERADASLPSVEVVPLAGLPGYESGPAFSPDGNQVAFSLFDEPRNSGIYATLVGGEKSLRLTTSQNDCCAAWSPDGREVAFLRFSDHVMDIYAVPTLGGSERRLYSASRPLWGTVAWSPDGKTLAFPESSPNNYRSWIALLQLGSSNTKQLTAPPDESRDADAVFSPDGSKVAFIRGTIAGVVNDVFVVDARGGNPQRLTFDNQPLMGLTWTQDGRDIVFSSLRGGQASLWRVSATGGTPRRVVGAGSEVYSPSISPKGNLLAYQQAIGKDSIRQINVRTKQHSHGTPAIIVSAKGRKMRPSFSPDGKRIAFESDRLGNMEIWVCESSGENGAQLTFLHGTAGTARWSPDGHHIAFEFHPNERAEIYVVDVSGGAPQMVSTIHGADNLAPSWSRDGKWIYFASKRGGERFQLWKVPFAGGSPVQMTRFGGISAAESPDRRFLYYSKYEADGIWRMPLNGGEEEQISDRPVGPDWFNWVLVRDGIYVLDRTAGSKTSAGPKTTLDYLDLATRKVTHLTSLDRPVGWGLAISPDGGSLLYVESDFEESNIMLVKNFR
jgi:Tol biopolymer transport system component/DNA-binding winged helix-turn-helix (wHTH) protein